MIRLTVRQIQMLHRDLIAETGESTVCGTKDCWIPLYSFRFKPLTDRRYIRPYSKKPPACAVHW